MVCNAGRRKRDRQFTSACQHVDCFALTVLGEALVAKFYSLQGRKRKLVKSLCAENLMPGAGPIVLFDKSALQILTIDEAVWFDTFYFPSMTPLFFVETLADLEKEMRSGSSPEEFVGALAEKAPLGGGINVHHQVLSFNELLGNRFELRHVPVVAGGNPVATRDGGRAVVFDPPPEAQALSRWEERQFLEVEHGFAKSWREELSAIDLDSIFRQGRAIIKRIGRPKDLLAAKAAAADTWQMLCWQ
jgi:hypothetical protein